MKSSAERNDASAALRRNPVGTRLFGRSALSLGLRRVVNHSLRLASRISSRKASVAPSWALIRGSLAADSVLQPADSLDFGLQQVTGL